MSIFMRLFQDTGFTPGHDTVHHYMLLPLVSKQVLSRRIIRRPTFRTVQNVPDVRCSCQLNGLFCFMHVESEFYSEAWRYRPTDGY